MTDMSSMSRESRKNQLRSRIVTGALHSRSFREDDDDSEQIIKKAENRTRRRHLVIFLAMATLIAAAVAALYWYNRSYQYRESAVVWERQFQRDDTGFVAFEPFGDNMIKYSKDGAFYIDARGKDVWIQSYQMRAPIIAVNGDYAAIADQQGNSIQIFNKDGIIGTATTEMPIMKIAISAKGLVAAVLQSSTASHIYYYTKEGTRLGLEITCYLNGEIGHPLDISLSPDGSLLMGSYIYLKGGELKNRVAFYNFSEVGKNVSNRMVGGFHEMYDSSMIPKVCYLDETYSVAFADNSISFYSSLDVMSPELLKQVPIEEEIKSIFYRDRYAGVIVKSASGESDYRLELYSREGNLIFSKDFSYEYEHVDIDGDNIFLYNEDSCRIYNRYGNLKYEGTFDFTVSGIGNGNLPNQIIVAGSQVIKELKLR